MFHRVHNREREAVTFSRFAPSPAIEEVTSLPLRLPLPNHMDHLKIMLSILQEHRLAAKRSKCLFEQPELQFLGHIISGHGVKPDPLKFLPINSISLAKLTSQVIRALRSSFGYRYRWTG